MSTSTVKYKCKSCNKIMLPLEWVTTENGATVTCSSCNNTFLILKKEIQSRTGRSSRNKGANFERKIAKQLEKWWPGEYEFKRTPGSGGSQLKIGFDLAGDIGTNAPNFKWHLELKNSSASWDGLDQILSNDGFILWKWYDQSIKDCPPHRQPMVIFTRVGRPTYCAASYMNVHDRLNNANISRLLIDMNDKRDRILVWLFDDLLNSNPAIWV